MSARLIPLTESGAPVITLQRPVLLIGRHPECDIRIDRSQISRRHCCVALAYDRLLIRDLGSRHGVWVNGRRVEEARLQAGDEVAIAHLIYRLEVEPAHVPSTPAPRAGKPPSLPDFGARPGEEEIDLIPLDDI